MKEKFLVRTTSISAILSASDKAKRKGNLMAKFTLEIVETLSRSVEVEADNLNDAFEMVEQMYSNEEIVLGAEDFVGYEVIDLYN